MPECLLFAYADQKPRLEALRLRDQSMAAAFPHMTKLGAENWLSGLRRAAQRISHAADSLFTLNGAPISVRGLRDRFSKAFGAGYSE